MSDHPTLKSPARWGLVLGLLLTFGAGVGCGILLAPQLPGGLWGHEGNPYVTLSTFERIKVGMSYDEVQALLGDQGQSMGQKDLPHGPGKSGLLRRWSRGQSAIEVWFGPDGKALGKQASKLV